MISLVIIRIIQNKTVQYKGTSQNNKWEMGLSGEKIQKTLNKWTVKELSNNYYRFNNIDDSNLKMVLYSLGIEIPVKLYRKSELKGIKAKIKIAT